MASVPNQGTQGLSLRNGCRCTPEPGVTVEELLLVVGEQVGFENIISASRMNKAVVVFLKTEMLINKLTVSGVWVKGTFVTVTPLSAPATKIIISNIPTFISNDAIMKELQRFGKIASPVKLISLGCKNVALKHVLSFRRQVYMFLSSPERDLDVSFRVNHGENSYMVYASAENWKCFECGEIGHKRGACPKKIEQKISAAQDDIKKADHQRNDKQGNEEKDGGVTEEVNEQNKVIENNVNENVQPGCSAAPDRTENGIIDEIGEQSSVENIREVNGESQVGGSEEKMDEEEMDNLSQCTDDGMRDSEEWLDKMDEKDLYTVEQINSFLDATKGKSGVEISDFFPDIDKFVVSVMKARKVSSYEELSQQKRFRLKKHITSVRQGKKKGKGGLTRGKT